MMKKTQETLKLPGCKRKSPYKTLGNFKWLRINSCNEDKGLISDSIIGPGDLGLVCNIFFYLLSWCIDFILIFSLSSQFFLKNPFVDSMSCSGRRKERLRKRSQVDNDYSQLPGNMGTAKFHLLPVLQITLTVFLFMLYTDTAL